MRECAGCDVTGDRWSHLACFFLGYYKAAAYTAEKALAQHNEIDVSTV